MTDLAKLWASQMKRAKIVEPKWNETVGPCHWSKTGWAVVRADGCCTCKPAKEPKPISLHDALRTSLKKA